MKDQIASRNEWLILLSVWLSFVLIQNLVYPLLAPSIWGIPINLKSAIEALYQGAIAFFIAFPVANRQLAKQRYTAFGLQAIALLFAGAFAFEFLVDPLVFGGRTILATVWPQTLETGTAALLLTAIRLLFQRQRSERRFAELQKAKIESELQYLKAQINPHVLFNALNNIYSHALHKSERTPTLILKLGDMLRYMIYDCADDEVDLERELEFISDYVEIQKLAVAGRGAVAFETRGDMSGERIPPFLLIPFVENCFKHCLDTQAEDIAITIGIEAANGRLTLDCVNSFDLASVKDRSPRVSGVGLANVRRRLELLMKGDFALEVGPGDKEYRVHLDIPVGA
ncbi:MAG: sensor histidine kinase [Erythrobacter sp.]|uniref:sensor histidine kinase n=1 Tax=Erythrobacter sp. TaxID=1042 RepID=UPI00260E8E83|nr:sensor histidine kinase [Erythrobacter sp.]MDJ0979172.1 sensor histidine kinase [Erythrobacter sp.]